MRLLILFACVLCSQPAWAYIAPGNSGATFSALL